MGDSWLEHSLSAQTGPAEEWSLQCLRFGSKLVSWCFEPSQPQRIISGLKTNFDLSPSYSIHESLSNESLFLTPQLSFKYNTRKSTQHPSYFTEHNNLSRNVKIISTILKCQPSKTIAHILEPFYTPRAHSTGICITCLWRQKRWPIIFRGPTQEPVLASANTGKTQERLWKNADEWTGRVKISKEEIPGRRRSNHGYTRTCSSLSRQNRLALGTQQMGL